MATKTLQYQPEDFVRRRTELMKQLDRKVFLVLSRCVLPVPAFKEAPSPAWHTICMETETDPQIICLELIQIAGMMLKLPQVAIETGQMYLRKFYYNEWFRSCPVAIMAMGSLSLAANLQGNPRKVIDVINVVHHINQVRTKKTLSPLVVDQDYMKVKDAVETVAILLLEKLGLLFYIENLRGGPSGNDFLSSTIEIDQNLRKRRRKDNSVRFK